MLSVSSSASIRIEDCSFLAQVPVSLSQKAILRLRVTLKKMPLTLLYTTLISLLFCQWHDRFCQCSGKVCKLPHLELVFPALGSKWNCRFTLAWARKSFSIPRIAKMTNGLKFCTVDGTSSSILVLACAYHMMGWHVSDL